MQTYTISGTAGGQFLTPQGTTVVIPPNAFVDQNNNPVTGSVTIQFKDIYKKSDMLLSNKPTQMQFGAPLKSAGEFFVKATVNNAPVFLGTGKKITVKQPLVTGPADTAMVPFVLAPDSFNLNAAWQQNPFDSLYVTASQYVFSLYQFSYPADSGTWSNSDNSTFFSAYTQTALTLHANDNPVDYSTDVFLVFKTVNSMVHVYRSGNDYPYLYAPVGLQCTMVAVGIKGSKLYAAFVPVTIGNNQTVNFSLTQITTADFKNQLKALN